jgi:D-lactate dehydrogenase
MTPAILAEAILAEFRAALGDARVFDAPEVLALYSHDETPRSVTPGVVLFPSCHEEVETLVRIADRYRIALVARGAGSGNVGGAMPVAGGAVVSFECMTRILEFRPEDRLIVVQSGVVTEDIGRAVRHAGLFYPPDPGSGAYCRIGGNLAMNAAGPRAVKYGTTRDWVLGLRAVTGSGEALTTGCRTTKGVTGYDLTRLLVGSEGTLALITEATLRLAPSPEAIATLRVCYDANATACAAVTRIMNNPVVPCALEFMDRRSIDAIRDTGAADDLAPGTQALLMVEADGPASDIPRQIAALKHALTGEGLLDIAEGVSPDTAALLWRARKSLSHAVKRIAPLKINEDIVVPVSRLSEMVAFLDAQAEALNIPVVVFGHAGNGNLHVNFMMHPERADEMRRVPEALSRMFDKVLELGGTLSGEHGIGTAKRDWIARELAPASLALQRAIKASFDPRGILNPDKMFPLQGQGPSI